MWRKVNGVRESLRMFQQGCLWSLGRSTNGRPWWNALSTKRNLHTNPPNRSQVEVGDAKLTLERESLGWQAVTAVKANQGESKVVAALASCSSFSDGTMQVRVNGNSSLRNRAFSTEKRVGTPIETLPMMFRKVFEKEFERPLKSTLVLDLNILQSNEASIGSLSVNAASLILFSTVFRGSVPIGSVSVAVVDGQVVVSPTGDQMARASLNMLYAGRRDAPVYFHASGEASMEVLVSALKVADEEASRVARCIEEHITGDSSEALEEFDEGEDLVALARVRDYLDEKMSAFLADQDFMVGKTFDLLELNRGLGNLKSECVEYFRKIGAFRSRFTKIPGSGCVTREEVEQAFAQAVKDAIIHSTVSKSKRIDGRGYGELRPTQFEQGSNGLCTMERDGTKLSSKVNVTTSKSPRTLDCSHSLAISAAPFHMRNSRHHIRALEYDLIQYGQESSFFTERAFSYSLPEFNAFPYYVKMKSQALSMDGSFPTANVCASSISLANAGVPMKYHIAGTSAGILNQEDSKPAILLDLVDLEERLVDAIVMMTSTGAGDVTSASLSGVKSAISFESLVDALGSAAECNEGIAEKMNLACSLDSGSSEGSILEKIEIPSGSRGKVIGPGGSHIKEIEALTGVIVSLHEKEDAVFVYGTDPESCKKAVAMLRKYAGTSPSLSVGKSYKVKVSKVLEYGAVVEIQEEGGDGWIHISELREGHVKSVGDELSVGQVVDATCIGKNARGTPQLSLKPQSSKPASKAPSPKASRSRGKKR
ncbi:polyribonucleotide nucleotidyltransferase [Chloropicon primus]|uniref:Polyribonucleotide nucleotidyltransferase n=1 Tax=Chloropicon primus TaxID=1764295 RepID=A0A5B8MLB2_9CHLO|nr:polyribonucleotide nucleotidyltransferase [Chloropicon primus]|eukprot:QDZ21199.1 polyribonucleotide nucleotidyltransferase [Chloropicon primus]